MGPSGLANLGAEGALYRDDRPVLDYAQGFQDSANELQVLRVMVDYLEPVAAFLEGEFVLEAGIAEIREKNLREMAARVFIRQAMDLISTGDHRGIAALCSEALRRHPDYLEAHQMLADALMQSGAFEKAGEHFAKVLEMEPEDGRSLDGRAVTLHQLGRLEEALPHYEAAVRFNPEDGLALNGLALALHQLGRFEEAVPHYEAALQLRPDRVETLVSLGEVFIQLGRYQEALSPLEKAVRLRPGFLKARRYLDRVRDSLKTLP